MTVTKTKITTNGQIAGGADEIFSPAVPSGPIVRYQVLRNPTEILVKTTTLNSDGSFEKKHGGQIPRGSTITTCVKPLQSFISEAFEGGVRQYILPANVELGTEVAITPKALIVEDAVDRSADTLKYVEGPAIVTFDHDPDPRAKLPLSGPAALRDILVENFPEAFSGAAWGGYASSSSNIYDLNGKEIVGQKGFHLVFAIDDARQIKDFTERLFKRLWLLGYGQIGISRSGTLLIRTIFDKKPLEPQQPIFSGGAYCIDCEQRRKPPLWKAGKYLQASGVCPLTPEEEREYKRLIEIAKLECKSECEKIRQKYVAAQIDQLTSARTIPFERARRIVETRLSGKLVGSDTLDFDEFGVTTVADVLKNPGKYEEATLADPVDGGAAGKAILYMNKTSGVPLIFSQKHGGCVFFLKHDLASSKARLETMDKLQALDEWPSILPNAELRADELEQYFVAVKEKTGMGLGVLRKSARDIEQSASPEDTDSDILDPGLYLADALLKQNYDNSKNLIQLESGSFWCYSGTHWAPVKDSVLAGQIQYIAENSWTKLLEMWAAFDKKPSTMATVVRDALASLGSRVVTPGDPLRLNSSRPSVINCTNGEVWLTENGPELRQHSPTSYLTSCSPVKYDQSATAPTFELAMRGILSLPGGVPMDDQDEMLRHMEELLGYAIQTRRNLKAFVLLVGPGDNGKTKITKLLDLILGKEAIAFDRLGGVDEKGNRFATSRLVGKLVLIDDDIDHNYKLPDGLLKKIAEEKPLTGEAKFKDSFSFVAQAVPFLLGNSWPRSTDLSRGMQTRANVIYLPRSFLKPDECDVNHNDRQNPEIWNKVYNDEMPGVLVRLIDAYYRVAKRNSFLPPPTAKRSFDMWLSEANVVARFIEDACIKCDPNKAMCTTGFAYAVFTTWGDVNGVQYNHRPQLNTFGKRFEELGYRVHHTKDGTSIFGISIKEEWQKVASQSVRLPPTPVIAFNKNAENPPQASAMN